MAMNFSANDIIVKDLNLKKKKSDKGNKQSISGLPNGQLGVSASKALTVPQLF
jgi:hypothetical protein